MERKEYVQLLTEIDRIRVKFAQSRGKILEFVIQYYSLIESRWRTIMRIDNCHGIPHQHVYHLRRREFRLLLNKDANIAFTEAKAYVVRNFVKIRENFIYAS